MMDDSTVPTPSAPRQSLTSDHVETVIAVTGVTSAALAFTIWPAALALTILAVAADIIWKWTR